MTAQIERLSMSDKQSLGILTAVNMDNQIFVCKTLELAWKWNKPNISCIPAGVYECKYTRSNRLSQLKGTDFYTYEVLGVKDRAGIRIHSANYFFQLLGCIALGAAHKDLNADGQLDVIHSGKTIKDFEDFMDRKNFILRIK
ncbi:MAG: DUF5675 family protein [Flavobacteriales bacterium]|nr:DUF5675 family protein [Flavobacteriales bacterium]